MVVIRRELRSMAPGERAPEVAAASVPAPSVDLVEKKKKRNKFSLADLTAGSGLEKLFGPNDAARLLRDPFLRWSERDWTSFSSAQRAAIIRLRANAGGVALRTLDQVLAGAIGEEHRFVVSPWHRARRGTLVDVHQSGENVMHPSDDPEKRDDEFTERRGYTVDAYHRHLYNMGKIIRAINSIGENGERVPLDEARPDIASFTEIESIQVLQDLIDRELPGMGYTAYLVEGEDTRGIDVGLITKHPLWPGTKPYLVLAPELEAERGVLRVDLDVEGVHVIRYTYHGKSMRQGEERMLRDNRILFARFEEDRRKVAEEFPDALIIAKGDSNMKLFADAHRETMRDAGIEQDPARCTEPHQLWDATVTIPDRRKRFGPNEELPAELAPGTHKYGNAWEYLDRDQMNRRAMECFVEGSLAVLPNAGRYFDRNNDTSPEGVGDHLGLSDRFDLTQLREWKGGRS